MKPLNIQAQVIELRDQGLTQQAAANKLGMTRTALASYCYAHKIRGWPQGAAARNQTGDNNPNATKFGFSKASIRRATEKAVLADGRSLFTCERCGVSSETPLPRHHKDRDRTHNIASNIEVLCVPCHNREHMPERQRDERGRLVCRQSV